MARAPRCSRATATSCAAGTSTRWSPNVRSRPAPRSGRRPRRSRRSVDGGMVVGAQVKKKETGTIEEVRARYVVVADGSNSRFGRALGAARDRTYPLGMAVRGYFDQPPPRRSRGSRATSTSGTATARPPPRLRLDLPGRRRDDQRGRRPAVHLLGLEGHQHQPADGGLLRDRTLLLGHLTGDGVRGPHRAGSCPTGLSVKPSVGPDVAERRRRRRDDQPLQR